jgi:hypothetical protein
MTQLSGEHRVMNRGYFVENPKRNQNQLTGWRDSLSQWSRWVIPSSRASEPDGRPLRSGNPAWGHKRLSSMHSRIFRLALPETPAHVMAGWFPPQLLTTTIFGQILHNTRAAKVLPSYSEQFATRHPRILSSIVPPPSVFSSFGLSLTSVPVTTSLVLRFSPECASRNGDTCRTTDPPIIELALTVSETQRRLSKLTWDGCEKNLFAILSTHDTDILLPTQHVDCRIKQVLQAKCRPDTLSETAMEELRLFVDMSDLNLRDGRMATPSKVSIPIPFSLRSSLAPLGPSTTNEAISSQGPSEVVKYIFGGLELRQTIQTRFLDYLLVYTNTEAGHHGGRQMSLSLQTCCSLIPEEQDSTSLRRKYLDAVQDIVSGAVFPWFQAV